MRPQYQLEKHPKAKSHIVQASPLCAFPPSRASELRPGNQRGLDSSRAGKKRDWDEAGSTYGGGLEEQDEEAKFSVEEDKAHRKKRRTKRRSDANTISRGKKRDRDLEDDLGASDGKGNLTLPANSQEDERQAGNKQYEEGSKPSPSLAPIFGSGTPASTSPSTAQNPFGVSQQSTTSKRRQSKLRFLFRGSTTPAGTPPKTAFSFGTAAAPSGTNNATGSAFAFGTP
ncbi:hypothetical protein F5880DRAFT_1657691 [Lentinula raphanica]|nr:hypothetical protein F5880DRAFT_1657691 [Lentinula raphanica]